MVQLPLALAMSLGMGSTQNWCVSIIFSWNQKEGRELGKGVLASKNSTLLLPKTSSRPGFCASFGCYDSPGWPACCGPCRSPVSKCFEEAFSTSLNVEKPQSWPRIYWCRWVESWMFQDWTDFFLNERYLLKEKELGSIAGLARLPPLFQGSHKGELSKPPEVDDFDQRNGSSYHLRHLEDEDFMNFTFCIEWIFVNTDLLTFLDYIAYIYISIHLFTFVYVHI